MNDFVSFRMALYVALNDEKTAALRRAGAADANEDLLSSHSEMGYAAGITKALDILMTLFSEVTGNE